MKLLFQFLLLLPFLLGALALGFMAWRHARGRRLPAVEFANIAEGTVAGNKSYLSDEALATRFLLVKLGTDANHIAIAGAADIPIGVATDEAAAAEDLVNVGLLGSSSETRKAVASAAIAVGAMIVAAASGKVRTLPGTTGTYYIIGRALQAAGADGDVIEFDPYPCIQRVVP